MLKNIAGIVQAQALPGALALRLVGRGHQLLSGLTEVFLWTPADNS